MKKELKVKIINNSVLNYFKEHNVPFCKPKDLMPYLIQQGLFKKDYRNGLPLRNILRELDKNTEVEKLIPSIRIERKKSNRFWFFDKQK